MGKVMKYFAGGNTAEGFVSFFPYVMPQKSRNRMYYIKGGPGVGKSSFMKRVGVEMEKAGYAIEYFYCSGDPECLDGVAIPALGIGLMDATAPHSYDPVIPGACDTLVSLGDYLDEEALSPYVSEIEHLGTKVSTGYRNAYHYLKAASELKRVISESDLHDTVYEIERKVRLHADRLAEQYFGQSKEMQSVKAVQQAGNVRKLFLEAYTHMGYISHMNDHDWGRIVLIPDLSELATDVLLRELLTKAVTAGMDAVVLHNPLQAALLSHLYIPSEDVLFTGDGSIQNQTHPCEIYKPEDMICREAFQDHQYEKLIQLAVEQLKSAKKAHDELEVYYIDHMDFACWEEKLNQVLTNIKNQTDTKQNCQ